MTATHLLNVPKADWAETIVQAVARLYADVFPGRSRAVYISGSRAEGSSAEISDIDGGIIFHGQFKDPAEEALAHCRRISPLRLDIDLTCAATEDNPLLLCRAAVPGDCGG